MTAIPISQVRRDIYDVWFAVGFSLLLHATLVYFYPQLSLMKTFKLPERFEIELMPPVIQAKSNPEPPSPLGEQTEVITPQRIAEKKPIDKPTVKSEPKHQEPPAVLASEERAPSEDYTVSPRPATSGQTPAAEAAPQNQEKVANYGKPEGEMQEKSTNIEAEAEIASTDEAWDGYGQQLFEMVNKQKNYPIIAIRRNWEGDVKIVAKFVQGRLASVTIADMSGHPPLDEEAMRMVKKAITQLAIKGTLAKKTFTVTIPVSFRLDQG